MTEWKSVGLTGIKSSVQYFFKIDFAQLHNVDESNKVLGKVGFEPGYLAFFRTILIITAQKLLNTRRFELPLTYALLATTQK